MPRLFPDYFSLSCGYDSEKPFFLSATVDNEHKLPKCLMRRSYTGKYSFNNIKQKKFNILFQVITSYHLSLSKFLEAFTETGAIFVLDFK